MNQNIPTAQQNGLGGGGNASPYFGSKTFYFGDDKAKPIKRGAELLLTQEEDDSNNFQPNTAFNSSISGSTQNQNHRRDNSFGEANQIFDSASKDKSRSNKSQNQFHGITGKSMKSMGKIEERSNVQQMNSQQNQIGPTISVINYNNPTINMNFNDNQPYVTSPQAKNNAYEEDNFYESLNYSKFSNSSQSSIKTPQQPHIQMYNPRAQQNIPQTKINSQNNIASSTMTTTTAQIMKTIPIPNPYSDNLAKTTKNMYQPMSQQVSRQNSQSELEQLDVEEIAQEVQKKKVTKKKIIKKIIKKKNPDGTDAPPQITTIIVDREGQKSKPANNGNIIVTGNQQPQFMEITQSEVQSLQLQQQATEDSTAPKKKIRKIIIKKKKKPEEIVSQPEVSQQIQQQPVIQPIQVQNQKLEEVKVASSKKQKDLPYQDEEIKVQQQPKIGKRSVQVKQQQQQEKEEETPKQVVKAMPQRKQKKPERREETEDDGQNSSEYDSSDEEVKKHSRKHKQKDEEEKKRSTQKRAQSVMGQKESKNKQKQSKKKIESESDSRSEEDDDEEEDESEYSSDERNDAEDSDEDSERQKLRGLQKQQRKFEEQHQMLSKQQKEIIKQKSQLEQQKQMQLQQIMQTTAQNGQILQPEVEKSKGQQQPLIQKPISFKVAVCDPDSYKAFVDQIIFGSKSKDLIMNPIPFQVGQLKFTIERHRSGFNRLHPSYYLYLEKNQGGRVLILYAKKRAFNKTANYLISMEKNKKQRDNDICLGKLRANPEGDKYILYDNGENFTKVHQFSLDKIRNEHGVFIYRYEPCNVGNIRKMIVVLPTLLQTSLPNQGIVDNTLPLGQDANGNLVVMAQKYWKPIREQDTINEVFQREGVRNNNYQVFVDNPPAWNPKTNTYVYDFKGRVTQPSIKNFQLIPELDGRRTVTLQDFVLQFGKNGKDVFILDVQYPFSVFQAFGLGLSAFDTD